MVRLVLALVAFGYFGQTPDATVPANAQVTLVAEGRGVQIYRCAALAWVFVAPEATLYQTTSGQPVGTHGTGPVWTWKDGSRVAGTVVAKMPSPDVGSIPWLLLSAKSTGTAGALADMAWVRRSDTHGGAAPASGCDAQHEGATVPVEYRATYTFYASQAK